MSNRSSVRAVGYCRVSTKEQDLSIDAQKDTLRAWAKQNKIQLVGIYCDVGVSGSTPWLARPGVTDATHIIRAGDAEVLVVVKHDRLSRDVFNAETYLHELRKHGAQVMTALDDPDEDQDSPEKQLMRQMLQSFAQFERSLISQRTRRALAVLKAQDKRLGRPRVVDYQTPAARAAIARIVQAYRLGFSASKTVKMMNDAGVPNIGSAKKWSTHTVIGVRKWYDGLTEVEIRDKLFPNSSYLEAQHHGAGESA